MLHRELDDALGLTDMAAGLITDPRTGRNGRHNLAGLLRQSVFPRLAAEGWGYAIRIKGNSKLYERWTCLTRSKPSNDY